jgi:hypothetical protein
MLGDRAHSVPPLGLASATAEDRNRVLRFSVVAETFEAWSLTSGKDRGCLRTGCRGEYLNLRDRSKVYMETVAQQEAYSL